MRVINCKDEAEFAEYNAACEESMNLPTQHIAKYADLEECGLRFPVIKEVAHLFPATLVVEYNGEDEEEE